MAGLRAAVAHQLGQARPDAVIASGAAIRFSPELPETLEPHERERLAAQAEALHPWLQGPFLLGGDLVVGGVWRSDQRWLGLHSVLADFVAGKRALDVGSNAGYDAFMLHLLGATDVLACEPFEFHEQAVFLESIYRTGIDLRRIGWEDLDPAEHGTFDLVHCNGVLYHELRPAEMIRRLASMVAPGGRLLLGTMMLAEPEHAEHARFVPGEYYNDPTWWWVPGRIVVKRLIEQAGMVVQRDLGTFGGPPGHFKTVNGYFEAAG